MHSHMIHPTYSSLFMVTKFFLKAALVFHDGERMWDLLGFFLSSFTCGLSSWGGKKRAQISILHIAFSNKQADVECAMPFLSVSRLICRLVHFRHSTCVCWKARDSKSSVIFMILQLVRFILFVRLRIKSKFRSCLIDWNLFQKRSRASSAAQKETK